MQRVVSARLAAGQKEASDPQGLSLDVIHAEMEAMVSDINVSHHEDQAEVHRAVESITACSLQAKAVQNGTGGVDELSSTVTVRRDVHDACRSLEQVRAAEMSGNCSKFDSFMAALSPPECSVPFPAADAARACLEQLGTWSAVNNKSFVQKEAQCNAAKTAVSEQQALCNSAQSAFESAVCSHSVAQSTACESQTVCHDESVARYMATQASVKEAEQARKAMHHSVKVIQCLLVTMGSTEPMNQSHVDNCKEDTIDVAGLDIQLPKVPNAPACDLPSVAVTPCNQDWLEAEYMGKAWYEVAPPQQCTPCSEQMSPIANSTDTVSPVATPAPAPSTSSTSTSTTTPPGKQWEVQPALYYDLGSGSLSPTGGGHAASAGALVDVASTCTAHHGGLVANDVQEFGTDDSQGTVLHITEGEGVYIPDIAGIIPTGADTVYTIRLVLKLTGGHGSSGWNRILNVNHGTDKGFYISDGPQYYPDGRGGCSQDWQAHEWHSLTVTTGPSKNTFAYIDGQPCGSWTPAEHWDDNVRVRSQHMLFFNDIGPTTCSVGGGHTSLDLKSIEIWGAQLDDAQVAALET